MDITDVDEWFWCGYLTHLIQTGEVTTDTPRAEVLRIKAEFMDGLAAEQVADLAAQSAHYAANPRVDDAGDGTE